MQGDKGRAGARAPRCDRSRVGRGFCNQNIRLIKPVSGLGMVSVNDIHVETEYGRSQEGGRGDLERKEWG